MTFYLPNGPHSDDSDLAESPFADHFEHFEIVSA